MMSLRLQESTINNPLNNQLTKFIMQKEEFKTPEQLMNMSSHHKVLKKDRLIQLIFHHLRAVTFL